MEKNAAIGPSTPDLETTPAGQKQAAERARKKTREELDQQDPRKRGADAVRSRLQDETK
jgi:hypothetical protein